MSRRLLIVDADTGEFVDGRATSRETLEAMARAKAKKQQISSKFAKYGNFYWLFYDIQKPLFEGNIDSATVTRLIYLATYMSYNDNKQLQFDNGNPIMRKDLEKVLGLSSTSTKYFLRQCKAHRLLAIDDSGIYVTAPMSKGKLTPKQKRDDDAIRIYISAVRELYKKTDEITRKNLSYLFSILPWVNRQYNIVCSNPEEKDQEQIKPLSTLELANLVGCNDANIRRFKTGLRNIEIDGAVAVSWVVNNLKKEKLFINPSLYYAGMDPEKVEILGNFCK